MIDLDDEFGDPVLLQTRICLLLAIIVGGYWFSFRVFRDSHQYGLAEVMFKIGYFATPPLAFIAFIYGMIALKKLHGKNLGRRGLAIVGTVLAIVELWAWLLLTIYMRVI